MASSQRVAVEKLPLLVFHEARSWALIPAAQSHRRRYFAALDKRPCDANRNRGFGNYFARGNERGLSVANVEHVTSAE